MGLAVPGSAPASTTVGARIDPDARVTDAHAAERQLVEITKALALEPRVLVLDEPTESLTAGESERLFARIDGHQARGAASSTSRIGCPRSSGSPTGSRSCETARRAAPFRRPMSRPTTSCASSSGAPSAKSSRPSGVRRGPATRRVLHPRRFAGLTGPRFSDIDLAVEPGEIVGLAGVEGNGQREFLRALAGLEPAHGEIGRQRSIAVVPGDRAKRPPGRHRAPAGRPAPRRRLPCR